MADTWHKKADNFTEMSEAQKALSNNKELPKESKKKDLTTNRRTVKKWQDPTSKDLEQAEKDRDESPLHFNHYLRLKREERNKHV